MHFARLFLAFIAATAAAGCASLPEPAARHPVVAFEQPASTRLGRTVLRSAPRPDSTGIRLLVSGEDAYASLTALADSAERTLDLQYYLVEGDSSGKALMARVRAAAERGVRVRLLIDDLNTSGDDAWMLQMTRHPRIEVRVYNPFPAGRQSTVSRIVTSLHDFGRINHRMHNKLFAADNAIAVTGGRNLGDAYFVHSASSNFVDLDVVVAGRAVRALSASFDRFWNDPLAYPIETLAATRSSNGPSTVQVEATEVSARVLGGTPASVQLASELAAGKLLLDWSPVAVIADRPSKFASASDDENEQPVAEQITELMTSVQRELVIISPYFVPGRSGIDLFKQLAARGVKLRVLTNSLATTDAPAVHIGYARYRPELLALGTELYELRPRLGNTKSSLGRFGASQASLHAKALIFDRQTVLVGSMNMDPRSARLNSEQGLVVRSPALAAQLVQIFEDVGGAGSYRVEMNDQQNLVWTAADSDEGRPLASALAVGEDAPPGGGRKALNDEPEASVWLKFILKVLAPLAPEEML